MKKIFTIRNINMVLVLMMLLAMPGTALARTMLDSTPSIAADQADYPPGAIVTLTGANWQPGEAVHIFVNDDAGQTWSLNSDPDPVTGSNGAFSFSFQLPSWFVANYSVTATGNMGSGSAYTSFTDLSIGTYDQCSNDDGDGFATDDTGCRWINGNLQSNNSTYWEGDATVQRV
jgi:hypothetical protein